MTTTTRYPEFEVSGTPFELGRQVGDVAREEIRGFAEIGLERVNKTIKISRDKAMAVAAESFGHVQDYSADMLDELRGMADSSGVSQEELMLLQIRNQLQAEDNACTAVAAIGPVTGSIVGQNWDNDPALDPFTIVLTRRPTGKPAYMSITQAGLIAYIGFNEHGLGMCMNTLPSPSQPIGVPHYFIVRGIFEVSTLDAVVNAVQRAQRAIGANLLLITPQGPADLEVTIDNVHVLREEGSGMVTHTNHCLHPDLLHINKAFPELVQSHSRKQRIDQLLVADGGPLNVERLKMALQDHENYPTSICRHTNDDPVTGFWTSVFSVIIEADAGRMHISRGNPCNSPFETYQLN